MIDDFDPAENTLLGTIFPVDVCAVQWVSILDVCFRSHLISWLFFYY